MRAKTKKNYEACAKDEINVCALEATIECACKTENSEGKYVIEDDTNKERIDALAIGKYVAGGKSLERLGYGIKKGCTKSPRISVLKCDKHYWEHTCHRYRSTKGHFKELRRGEGEGKSQHYRRLGEHFDFRVFHIDPFCRYRLIAAVFCL